MDCFVPGNMQESKLTAKANVKYFPVRNFLNFLNESLSLHTYELQLYQDN